VENLGRRRINNMSKFKPYMQCQDCKKIFTCQMCNIPEFCSECGTRLYHIGKTRWNQTNNIKLIVAKRTLKGWIIREDVN
jgi:rRNA maturation endonuclease Nob1